jgi:cytochrome oxidase complex assembly protein 1
MATPRYPLSYAPVKKSWLDRNARWKIPLGCLTVIVFFGGFVAVIFTVVEVSFRKSAVYQQALDRTERNPEVANRIGVPLRPGRVLQGQLNVSGSSGKAHMAIPVTGSRGKATIYLDARKASGTWEFLTLQVQFEGQPDCLNLLAGPGSTSVICSQ